MEKEELDTPSFSKVLADHTIYTSHWMPVTGGVPILCDFGESKIGLKNHRDDIMPGVMRAPEVILGMEWDEKVDIWAMGLMVSCKVDDPITAATNITKVLDSR